MHTRPHIPALRRGSVLAVCACALSVLCVGQARGDVAKQAGAVQTPQAGAGTTAQGVSATLEQCVTALTQPERSATFSGEMTTMAGAERMQMRIDVEERLPGEVGFHIVKAPGLGVWRSSAPGVKAYKYLKQVTNLSAPAFYRAAVRFRWLNAKGSLITATGRRTPVCAQTAPPAPEVPPPAGGEAPTATTGSAPVTTG
jgi:hypothetical protein